MAGVLKLLDAGGTDRTITALKLLDAGGVDRTLQFVRVLDAGNVDREVFTAGGGGITASITPAFVNAVTGGPATLSANFTASASSGSPTAYAWGVLSGDGYVSAGGTSATATLSLDDPGGYGSSVFYCDVTVSAVVHRATCRLTFTLPRSTL